MRKAFLALALFAIVFSTAVYAQNETGNQTSPPDPCANVQCNSPPAAVCDGSNVKTYSSPGTCNNGICSYPSSTYSCQYGCSNGQCAQQTNFTQPPTTNATPQCPAPPPVPSCPNGYLKTKYENNCPVGYECVPFSTTNQTVQECRGGEVNYKSCPDGSTRYVERNCVDGRWVYVNYFDDPCKLQNQTACPPAPSPPACAQDEYLSQKYENNCIVGYECKKYEQRQCPSGCECKYDDKGNIVGTYCTSEKRCNYNSVCDKDEDTSCKDCIGGECPVSRECGDGSKVNCYKKEFGCQCEPCPLSQREIPPGCRQETDRGGFIRVVCEQRECQPVPQDIRIRCVDEGGSPRFDKDHRGCDMFQCDFGGQRSASPVFASPVKCPSPEEVSRALEKCHEFGLDGVIGFEGGCKIGKCLQEHREEKRCKEVSRKQIEQECWSKDMDVAPYYQDGCQAFRCVERRGRKCEGDLPKEAYDRCANEGGQLVVRRDQNGCVSYSNCIRRGNTEESFVEDIEEIPDTTELLSIAFKLEDLKLEFDKLAKKTNDIADYYKSTGSSEEKRFRRVSDMFSAAKDKVDEVKTKLRDRVADIDKDDVLEIKQDLRYLKDVILKDILFVMLGSGDEIEEIKSGSTKNCGTDGSCFDRAFRVCQPLTFRPEGRNGPIVEVKGLEGDACVMYVKMPEGQGPPGGPYDMTCKIQKYSLGVRNPETDIFPYCTGNMVELIKKYGTGPPGVPGKCSGDECRKYCGRGPQEAKECLQYLGDMLPPEAKEQLTAMAEGRTPSGFGGGFGPSDKEFERGEFGEEFREEFREEFKSGRGEFRSEFESRREFPQPPTTSTVQPAVSRGSCSGCLNNGVCDPGECSECSDCIRR